MKFIFEDKEYILNKENCIDFYNDEEKEVLGIDLNKVLNLINEYNLSYFDTEYYQEACTNCMSGVKEKQKFFEFLEYHFYIFTKKQKFVISDIEKSYENLSFNKLLKKNEVDDSYLVSIIVCKNCGKYTVQIENCEV